MDITIIKKMIREEYPMQDIFDKIDELQSEADDIELELIFDILFTKK